MVIKQIYNKDGIEVALDITEKVFFNFVHNPERLNIIILASRPMVTEAMMLIEQSFYKPETKLNEEYQFFILHWEPDNETEMLYGIVSVPMKDKNKIEDKLDQIHFRLADGIPTMFIFENGKKKVVRFPLNTPNSFTLEYTEKGHDLYCKKTKR